MNSVERGGFSKIVNGGILLRILPVAGRLRGGKHDDGRLAAPFAGPEMTQDLSAVSLRQVHVQQEKIRTGKFSVQIQAVDEGYDGLTIRDHAQIAMDVVIAQRLAHQPDISRVVFGKNDLAADEAVSMRTSGRL